MSDYVIDPPKQAAIPVAGSDKLFPVRRVFCIGRNYVAHVEEMGGSADRDPPLFFGKPADSVVFDRATIPYPSQTSNYHHEVELVLAIGKGGRNISPEAAEDHIWGYAVGLDMTRRDIQGNGKPWEIAKGFDNSFPVGAITLVTETGKLNTGKIKLTVNGEIRQESDISLLIWKIPEIISRLSEFFELAPGDVIMTGTPSGVGPVVPGDKLVATFDGLSSLSVSIGEPLS